jgi:hypothetical protein
MYAQQHQLSVTASIIFVMEDLPALAQLTQSLGIGDLGKDLIALHHISGNDIFRRNNFVMLDRETIGYASGSSVIIENIETHERKYLLSLDDGGVGCIAVHPTRKYLAVGCRGSLPNIYIYEFPSLKVDLDRLLLSSSHIATDL